MVNSVYILSGVRTAIGSYGGSLKNVSACDLATHVVAEAIHRSNLAGVDYEHCVLGNVLHSQARDMYISRVAALNAGMAQESQALTLNRLCGSGLQAVVTASQMIQLGDIHTAVAGGVENMSQAGYLLPAHRWGKRMGDSTVVDMLTGSLTDPFDNVHMGITAENVAIQCKIDRVEQDAFALESQRRAVHAITEGYFEQQIIPLVANPKRPHELFKLDENVRADIQLSDLANLRPVFSSEGSITVGNASSLNDAAAALTLVNSEMIDQQGLSPMAKIVSYGNSGVAPQVMGLGPINAVKQALKRANLSIADLDVIESNEAFASQACAVSNKLGFPAEKVNPNGGAIALGHPIGATGAIILIKAMYELDRTDGRYGLITMCIGGGQGIALVIERCE
ncbi:MAG: beta-ketothiolase BktB [Arenicella sp.]